MRIRSIKPEFWESESLGRVSREARLLFIGLFTCCDDSGRTRAGSRLLASRLYPYDDDANERLPGWLAELEREGCVRLYSAEGESYLEIPKWLKHQKIDRPSPSKLPSFARIREDSRGFEKNSLGTGNREQGEGKGTGSADAPLSLPPNGETGNPNLIPFAPTSEPVGSALPKIAALHKLWQELTGQPAVRLDASAERRWFEYLRAGWGEPELRRVVDSIQRGITRRERNRGALRLSNLIDPTQFNEELGMATSTGPKPKARPPEPEKPAAPLATPEQLAEWSAKTKALREKLTGKAPEPTPTPPATMPALAPTLPQDVLNALQAAQDRNRGKIVTV